MTKLGRVGAATTLGLIGGLVSCWFVPWAAVPLLVWVIAAVAWLVQTLVIVWGASAESTRKRASQEDPHGATADTLLLAASVASLGAVVLGVLKAANSQGAAKLVLLTAGVSAIVCAWAVVHVVFMLRYADLYYRGPVGGIDFNEKDPPTYGDFAYLSFTIGMTYQVSDTDLQTKTVRHAALRHALLSYLLGTVTIATTINIAAGLAH